LSALGARELDHAIDASREAILASDPKDPRRAEYVSNLGVALMRRYERTGATADLDDAIDASREAVAVNDPKDPRSAEYVSNLGVALMRRYERTRATADLDDAIDASREAVAVSDPKDPRSAEYVSNLGVALMRRYERTGATAELDDAIDASREAVNVSDPKDPRHAEYRYNLAAAFMRRYELSRAPGDLQEAKELGATPQAETEAPSPERPIDRLSDQVEWVPDSPATLDLLSREGLAGAVADRLRRLRCEEPTTSFLIHIDGPWGSGKTTLMEFVTRRLSDDFLVVRFDAWRQSVVGPPWWSLLMALRRAVASETGVAGRISLRLGEARERIARGGMPYLVSLIILAAVAAGLLLLFHPALDPRAAGDFARSISAVLAAVATLWLGTRLLGKLLFWDSAAGARIFENAHENPMESLADHFAWLIHKAQRPVLFAVDDLDRCDKDYVVNLLDAVQTLIRDVPERQGRSTSSQRLAPYFLVAAHGSWIRRSYEVRHEQFQQAVGTPGRPLGDLFLNKIFQLTVDVPSISLEAQSIFLGRLLRADTAGSEDLVAQTAIAVEEISRSASETEVLDVLEGASPEVRLRVAGSAIDRLTRPEIERTTEHALEKFAPLLEPNPRAIKRFVNAYGMARASSVLTGRVVRRDSLALWTILRLRWPGLAEYLHTNHEAIDAVTRGQGPPANCREDLAPLFYDPGVVSVVTSSNGGPLTPDHIKLCCGILDALPTHDCGR
jgi:hypothetical protein